MTASIITTAEDALGLQGINKMNPLQIFKTILNALSTNSLLQRIARQLVPQSFYAFIYTTAAHISSTLHVMKEVVDPAVSVTQRVLTLLQSAEVTALENLIPGMNAEVANLSALVTKAAPAQTLINSLIGTIDGVLVKASGSALMVAGPDILTEVQTFITAETYTPAPDAFTTRAIITHVKIQAATEAITAQHAPAATPQETQDEINAAADAPLENNDAFSVAPGMP